MLLLRKDCDAYHDMGCVQVELQLAWDPMLNKKKIITTPLFILLVLLAVFRWSVSWCRALC